jgi:hypothetical protein
LWSLLYFSLSWSKCVTFSFLGVTDISLKPGMSVYEFINPSAEELEYVTFYDPEGHSLENSCLYQCTLRFTRKKKVVTIKWSFHILLWVESHTHKEQFSLNSTTEWEIKWITINHEWLSTATFFNLYI